MWSLKIKPMFKPLNLSCSLLESNAIFSLFILTYPLFGDNNPPMRFKEVLPDPLRPRIRK